MNLKEKVIIRVMSGRMLIQEITLKSNVSASSVLKSVPYTRGDLFDEKFNAVSPNAILCRGETYLLYPAWGDRIEGNYM